jgi:hypothetical protein
MTQDKRLEIRKQIQKAGYDYYTSFPDGNLKWIVGELMSLNEDRVLAYPETYGSEYILKHGLTENQHEFVEGVREESTDKGWDRELKVQEKLAKMKEFYKDRVYELQNDADFSNIARSDMRDERDKLKRSRDKLAETMIYQIKFPAHMFCKFVKDDKGVHRPNGTDDKKEAIESWIKWSEINP